MDELINQFKKQLPQTIEWKGDHALMIDQQLLPGELKFIELRSVEDVVQAIYNMNIRGAQAIEGASASGMALAALSYSGSNAEDYQKHLKKQGDLLIAVRPTAVNLAWAVNLCLGRAEGTTVEMIKSNLLLAVADIFEKEVEHNIEIGKLGAELIPDHSRILTHCNAGSLSSIWFGTALAPIFTAHLAEKDIFVHVDETRPKLQGSRLTAWELDRVGIDYAINVDSAAGYLMQQHKVDLIIVGADRIAKNGDVANKIGTYPLAVLAHEHKIPFYVAAVRSTVDDSKETGQEIAIEDRDDGEVVKEILFNQREVAPNGAKAENPVFDVTPAKYITKIITEDAIHIPSEL